MTVTGMQQPGRDGKQQGEAVLAAETFHTPVMVNEVMEVMRPVLGRGTLVDATVGGAGHAYALLKGMVQADKSGGLLGLDVDVEALAAAKERLGQAGFAVMKADSTDVSMAGKGGGEPSIIIRLVRASYAELVGVVERLGLNPVAGVLMDLGVSLHQLTKPERGFSFEREGPIDMRFDQESGGLTALSLLKRSSARTIGEWLFEYGQEPHARRVARLLYERRHELRTTSDIVRIVKRVAPARSLRSSLARVFQAIRIATNRELAAVAEGLAAALKVLMPGGRLAVISYHSGEDRVVKECLRKESREGRLRLLTKKPQRPSAEEVMANPRARSARLRAAEVKG